MSRITQVHRILEQKHLDAIIILSVPIEDIYQVLLVPVEHLSYLKT